MRRKVSLNLLTYIVDYVILFMSGGDFIYALVIIIFSTLVSYNIVSFYFISKKSEYVNSTTQKLACGSIKNYFNSIDKKLSNLSYPYGLSLKKYLIIKYIFSSFLFMYTFIRDRNVFNSLTIFLFFYFLPNILIIVYKKAENIKIINEISNIVQSQILSLSANMPFYESLKISLKSIHYKRFIIEYQKFIDNYEMYNFNILRAIEDFKRKFDSYEFNMFLTVLLECEREGNALENLEAFDKTLDLAYFKYLKLKSTNRIIFISVATVISLINVFLIVMYPIAIQISQNITDIFK